MGFKIRKKEKCEGRGICERNKENT